MGIKMVSQDEGIVSRIPHPHTKVHLRRLVEDVLLLLSGDNFGASSLPLLFVSELSHAIIPNMQNKGSWSTNHSHYPFPLSAIQSVRYNRSLPALVRFVRSQWCVNYVRIVMSLFLAEAAPICQSPLSFWFCQWISPPLRKAPSFSGNFDNSSSHISSAGPSTYHCRNCWLILITRSNWRYVHIWKPRATGN